MGASFHPSYTVLTGNSAISKYKGTSLWNSVPNSVLMLRYIDRRNVLPTWLEKGRRSEHDKLDRHRSTKLTTPPSSDACPLVYHSNHQAVSTAQFRCAGQLATADTCLTEMSIHYACFDRFSHAVGITWYSFMLAAHCFVQCIG